MTMLSRKIIITRTTSRRHSTRFETSSQRSSRLSATTEIGATARDRTIMADRIAVEIIMKETPVEKTTRRLRSGLFRITIDMADFTQEWSAMPVAKKVTTQAPTRKNYNSKGTVDRSEAHHTFSKRTVKVVRVTLKGETTVTVATSQVTVKTTTTALVELFAVAVDVAQRDTSFRGDVCTVRSTFLPGQSCGTKFCWTTSPPPALFATLSTY